MVFVDLLANISGPESWRVRVWEMRQSLPQVPVFEGDENLARTVICRHDDYERRDRLNMVM
jgi:hypothetical protein